MKDYDKCNHDTSKMGAVNIITNKVYCDKCLNEKFKAEGTPFEAMKNMMLGFIRNYPNALTEKELIESSNNPYKIHNGGKIR